MYHTVYVIQSARTGKIYVGCTSNPKRRLSQHNHEESFSTKGKGPWILVYSETYRSRKDAKIREKGLKYYGRALGQLKRRIKNSMLKDKLIFET